LLILLGQQRRRNDETNHEWRWSHSLSTNCLSTC
jgi:hypothetical protein